MTRDMIKLHPAQINTQAAIELTLRRYRHGIRAGHVRKLILHGNRNVAGGVQGSAQAFAPASREGADHSTHYVMAPQRLLDLCNRLSTVEDVEKLIESCNIER